MNHEVAIMLLLISLPGDLPSESKVKAVKIADIPHFCEGIVFDASGAMYVSDMMEGTIYRVTTGGMVTPWGRTKKPNGHKILKDGTHLVCDAEEKAILRLDASGKIIGKASSGCDGKPLLGPNDIALDYDGGFYFSDPEGSGVENPIGSVCYVDRAGITHRVVEGLAYPNGVVVSKGGTMLIVGEGERNRILTFEILSPGNVGPMRVLATLPERQGEQIDDHPDGIALDESGNLYIAHYGMGRIQVLSPGGKLLRSYKVGNLSCSNVAFWGPRMDELFTTGAVRDQESAGTIVRLDLPGVQGMKIPGQ